MLRDKNIYKFYDQVKQEANRVIWPKRQELFASVIMVISVVAAFSLFFLILDYGIYSIIQFLLNVGK